MKVRGGECLGTFQTLVNPGLPIPPQITVLTGITESMVLPAPRIEAVLPALLEFVGDAVHRRPQRPLRPRLPRRRARAQRPAAPRRTAASTRAPWPAAWCATRCPTAGSARWPAASGSPTGPPTAPSTTPWPPATCCTCCSSGPRALGVLGLDDLLALPTIAGHPQVAKLAPHRPAAPHARRLPVPRPRRAACSTSARPPNLRTRVRSYFSGDDRRKVGQLLREVHRIDHVVCAGAARGGGARGAADPPARAPASTARPRGWRSYAYLKLTARGVPPALGRARTRGRRRALPRPAAVGPRPRRGSPRRSRRRCRCAGAPADPGHAGCGAAACRRPSSAWPPARAPARLARPSTRRSSNASGRGLTVDPTLLLDPLGQRMRRAGRRRALRGGGRRARPGRRPRPRPPAPAPPRRAAPGRSGA